MRSGTRYAAIGYLAPLPLGRDLPSVVAADNRCAQPRWNASSSRAMCDEAFIGAVCAASFGSSLAALAIARGLPRWVRLASGVLPRSATALRRLRRRVQGGSQPDRVGELLEPLPSLRRGLWRSRFNHAGLMDRPLAEGERESTWHFVGRQIAEYGVQGAQSERVRQIVEDAGLPYESLSEDIAAAIGTWRPGRS